MFDNSAWDLAWLCMTLSPRPGFSGIPLWTRTVYVRKQTGQWELDQRLLVTGHFLKLIYVCMSLSAGVPWHTSEGQKATSGVRPHLLPWLGQSLVVFTAGYTTLASLWISRDFSVLVSCLPTGTLGLQSCAPLHLAFKSMLGIRTQVVRLVQQALLPAEPPSQPQTMLYSSRVEFLKSHCTLMTWQDQCLGGRVWQLKQEPGALGCWDASCYIKPVHLCYMDTFKLLAYCLHFILGPIFPYFFIISIYRLFILSIW